LRAASEGRWAGRRTRVFQDQTFAGYQTILSGLASGGFQPTIVAATGPQGSIIFAGVLEETFNVHSVVLSDGPGQAPKR
jgi:hypothetical protein